MQFHSSILLNILSRLDEIGVQGFPTNHFATQLRNTEWVTAQDFGGFLEAVVQQTQDHRLGLKLGLKSPLSTLNIVGQIYQTCSTFAEVLHKIEQHASFLDGVNQYFSEIRTDGIYQFTVPHQTWQKTFPLASRQVVEHNIGFSIRCKREYLGREIKPVAIWLPYPQEGKRDVLENYFKCPILFEKPCMAVILPKEMLEWKVPTANPVALQWYETHIQTLRPLQKVWYEKTRNTILQLFKLTVPTVELVARQLGISQRSLQRNLKNEATSFQNVLDDVRLELAKFYLVQPAISMIEVGERLGFEVQSAFNKFIQRTTGKSPSVLQEEYLQEQIK
jgi:AraC-like DNA-binding protein